MVGTCSLLAVLVLAPPSAGRTRPTYVPPISDRSNVQRLRVPELSFGHTSTLYILGKGRFGTWSILGGSVGGTLGCTAAVHCLELASAQVGIAWRPFGSLVSLFSAVGVSVVPGTWAPPGFQVVSGLRVDLPSWRWRRR